MKKKYFALGFIFIIAIILINLDFISSYIITSNTPNIKNNLNNLQISSQINSQNILTNAQNNYAGNGARYSYTDGINGVTENINNINELPNIPKLKGYIIEFQQQPLVKNNQKSAKDSIEREHNNVKTKIIQVLNSNSPAIKTSFFGGKSLKILGEYKKVFNGIALNITQSEAEIVKAIPGVKKVYPNMEVHATLMDSVPLINADKVWKLDAQGGNCLTSGRDCLTGKGIKIAIIDTGVDYTHPDFLGCTTSGFLAGSCNKFAGGYDFINNDNDPIDDMGHGTHVAATAAGNGVLKGVAPDASIIAYKVLDAGGSGSGDTVISGIERAVDPDNNGDFSDHADIISMSLGGSGNPDDPLSKSIDNAVSKGVVAVIAAGNSGPSEQTISSPGTARKAITVGATDKQDFIASFSSRGLVVWQDENGITQYLMKPDVLAPGVDICAAEYDSAWSDRKCLDDKHISISGTSMATPHVAGAVALIKQAHPDWTPEEIKAALKGTAKDLGYSSIEQGAGRIDALVAVNSQKPLVAELYNGREISEKFNILGTAKGDDFSYYEVYYLINGEKFLICNGNNAVVNNILCRDINSFNFNEGKMELILKVYGHNGRESKDTTIVNINNFEITSVGNTLNYIKGNELIKGKISTQNYDSYKIQINNKNGDLNNWEEVCSSNVKPTGDVLCSLNANSLENGEYFLRISILRNGIWLLDEPFKIVVIHELMDNWPIEFPCYSSSFITPLDTITGGHKEIATMDSIFCGRGWVEGNFINIIDASANSKPIYNLYKNGNLIPYINFWRNSPTSTFYNTFSAGASSYFGIVDTKGNFINNWPISLHSDKISMNPFGQIVYDNNKLFMLTNIYDFSLDTSQIYLSGFDLFGNRLENFPIKIEGEEGLPQWTLSTRPVLIENNGQKYLGVMIAFFNNWDEAEDRNGKLFFDIYSLSDGHRVKRTILSEDMDKKVRYDGWSFVSGDLNNDGNTEVAVGYMVFDLDKFYENEYNAEAYKSYLKILDSNGNIISKPFAINGYTIENVRIGNFLESAPTIVFQLTDTWPTTYDGQRIIGINYFGNILFDINLKDYNKIITGISIGDINGDRQSEIAIAYRPRWWGGVSSGILIYDKTGELVKEFIIPTFGEVDIGTEPVLIDFNNDGYLDIIFKTSYISKSLIGAWKSHIFVFETGAIYNKFLMDWPMFQHDPQHTGCYDCDKEPSKIFNPSETTLNVGVVMKLQKKINNAWQDMQTVIDSYYTIPPQGSLDLAQIWNSASITRDTAGYYRVYAVAVDKEGMPILDLNNNPIESWHEFEVKPNEEEKK